MCDSHKTITDFTQIYIHFFIWHLSHQKTSRLSCFTHKQQISDKCSQDQERIHPSHTLLFLMLLFTTLYPFHPIAPPSHHFMYHSTCTRHGLYCVYIAGGNVYLHVLTGTCGIVYKAEYIIQCVTHFKPPCSVCKQCHALNFDPRIVCILNQCTCWLHKYFIWYISTP